jgi:hypothetical protein
MGARATLVDLCACSRARSPIPHGCLIVICSAKLGGLMPMGLYIRIGVLL